MPSTFHGFSYLYDRTGAIGLLDDKPATFGSQRMSGDDISDRAKIVCAMDAAETSSKFAAAGDASKSANFCGDVVYLSVLLDKLGFNDHASMTMTNKIKDVELVWTLGAMLAKSAELAKGSAGQGAAASASGGWGAIHYLILVLASLAAYYYFCAPSRSHAGHQKLSTREVSGFPP